MFTEDNLATAQIAQLFGSELLKVQQNATTDSGSQPEIVKIDPKQFLVNVKTPSAKRAEEQRLIQMLQREAEAACPLPPEPIQTQPSTSSVASTELQQPLSTPRPIAIPSAVQNSDVWEKINFNLERIANKLESIDLSVKKKRIKRINK